MELRPRPPGREYRGYTRVAVRRWIKDPAEEFYVPPEIERLSEIGFYVLRREAEKHRSAIKNKPQRPAHLDKDFPEPEIFTVRRSVNKAKYLQRHPDMMEPYLGDKRPSSSSSISSSSKSSSKTSSKVARLSTLSADTVAVKIEELRLK